MQLLQTTTIVARRSLSQEPIVQLNLYLSEKPFRRFLVVVTDLRKDEPGDGEVLGNWKNIVHAAQAFSEAADKAVGRDADTTLDEIFQFHC